MAASTLFTPMVGTNVDLGKMVSTSMGEVDIKGEHYPYPGDDGRDRTNPESLHKARVLREKASGATSKSSGSGRQRQDSLLRRAKEDASTPAAATPHWNAQRSKPAYSKTLDSFASPRERQGSQFRVANVGLGGRIYLRPVAKPAPEPTVPQSPTRSKPSTRVERACREDEEEDEECVDDELGLPMELQKGVRTDFSGRESVWTKLSSAHDSRTAPSDIFRHRPRSTRSMSESTVSQGPVSRPAALAQTKAFKVVIDRPDNSLPSNRHTLSDTLPGLDIPIPHYRMGSPRFSMKGTPFLHSSVYTHSSNNVAPNSSTTNMIDRVMDGMSSQRTPIIPTSQSRPGPPRRHSHASPYMHSLSSLSHDSTMAPPGRDPSAVSHQSSFAGREPISPAIYDTIAAAPNDPSIVRYAANGREVVAATPARLIVQITAETFLDYELLSDFFLTVRSYLSIHDLLALLLARFEWAVNRLDDNGRIIRVRSFAAIRHWILNYFAYDFVPDRMLRVIFCRKINALFKIVQSRMEDGASDMKLIADLKKCWNGRCVMYWDKPVDNALEADILPGGPGPNDPEDCEDMGLGSVTEVSTDASCSGTASPRSPYPSGPDRASGYGHHRTISGATSSSAPLSPTSEISAPVVSCSIPVQAVRRAAQNARHIVGPVPTGQRPQTNHRDSVGSSDAVRETQAAEHQQAVAYPLQTSMYRSVLRGHLLRPADPYVTTAPTTPGLELRQLGFRSLSPREADITSKKIVFSGSSGGPGMKSLIGNIKRALTSKTSSGDAVQEVVVMDNGTIVAKQNEQKLEGLGRSANIPMEILNQMEASAGTMGSVRAAMRVDVLAEQVALAFAKAIQDGYPQRPGQPASYNAQSQNATREQMQETDTKSPQPNKLLHPPQLKHLPSGMTSSSQSIVIFDDTGADVSVAALEGAQQNVRPPQVSARPGLAGNIIDRIPGLAPEPTPLSRRLSTGDVGISSQEVGSAMNSLATTPARRSFVGSPHNRQPSHGSASLRRVASYQSTLNKPSPVERSLHTTNSASGPSVDQDSLTGLITPSPANISNKNSTNIPESAVPARGLRRVPGGDLRANQNIADLELQITRPKSTGSIATFSSTRESEMLSFGDRITKTFKRDRAERPLISPSLTTSFPSAVKDDKVKEKKVSYIRTNSDEKATRRPSFEAVVASFADIPDEEEGGIEATLMKLEGRYRKGAVGSNASSSKSGSEQATDSYPEHLKAPNVQGEPSTRSVGTVPRRMSEPDHLTEPKLDQNAADRLPSNVRETLMSTEYANSEDSYNSTPLLERGADSMAPPRVNGKSTMTSQGPTGLRAPGRTAAKSFLLDEQEGSVSDRLSVDSRVRHDNAVLNTTHPPSPPMTSEQAKAIDNGATFAQQQRKPPTPDPSPNRHFVEPHHFEANGLHLPSPHIPPVPGLPHKHMCFILGHDSQRICEQLTLIEKDALREIDWRDLVDMRWRNSASTATNWVHYLTNDDPLGVDMVTARFNILVKWALSEIVLTESLEERALTVIKYIHIARAARAICNYATLLQLTIALTSADCQRLRRTWDLVPAAEKNTLRELEALVSPRRNFAALRAEMEENTAETGCIPVLALYIHDLTYNAQKPAIVEADTPGGGLLVNFERYRSAAGIVKNLLRLIDASSRYAYVPVDDVLSHCMWMACLPDEEITRRSRALEAAV